jgi:hypothetical protein
VNLPYALTEDVKGGQQWEGKRGEAKSFLSPHALTKEVEVEVEVALTGK